MNRFVFLCLFLSSCTQHVDIEDKRLTKEEVAAAFHERDAVYGPAIKKLQEKVTELEKNQLAWALKRRH